MDTYITQKKYPSAFIMDRMGRKKFLQLPLSYSLWPYWKPFVSISLGCRSAQWVWQVLFWANRVFQGVSLSYFNQIIKDNYHGTLRLPFSFCWDVGCIFNEMKSTGSGGWLFILQRKVPPFLLSPLGLRAKPVDKLQTGQMNTSPRRGVGLINRHKTLWDFLILKGHLLSSV